MPDNEHREAIADILRQFSGLNSAKSLLSELNYDAAKAVISRKALGKTANTALAEDPQIFAQHDDFHFFYCKLASDRLPITLQRAVVTPLLKEHPYSLFIFTNQNEDQWSFVNVKLVVETEDPDNLDSKKRRLFRRITIRRGDRRLRTAIDRISLLDLAQIQPELFGIPPLTIQTRHDNAFDVEAVTKAFYADYETAFKTLWSDLEKQTKDHQWAHDYSLQFLNRLMFLYFVQRKGWLGDDGEFLDQFWNTYTKSNPKNDSFFEEWLKVLFFEAFNNNKNLLNTPGRSYLPKDIRAILWKAPFLNGGLFRENPLDAKHTFKISDRRFGQIFNFFQHYNFTISEDSPLDQEVAVDPEMIGKVYEGLVNVSDTADERGDAGIFYTPRTEIDLMCRLTLVDQLCNHLGCKHKSLFYNLVFALDQDEKDEADRAATKAKLWEPLHQQLTSLTVLDPACGSGSFLVGMLYVLNDLITRAEAHLGKARDPYARKKDIIGRSLYGVDVMDWARHVAELRLWLSLIIDAEFTEAELTVRKEPLLPHFSFKVRCGDSLVQEVGGVDMAHRRGVLELSGNMKRKLRELRREKAKFYDSDKTCKFKTVESLESEEVVVFRDLLQDRITIFDNQAKDLMRIQAETHAYRQRSLLTGELEGPAEQFTLEHERREQQISALKEESKSLEIVQTSIRSAATIPFVWDIAFAEIFSGNSHGFDIVIGNPPYVRGQKIADPQLPPDSISNENKKQYKAKLARSVYRKYPSFFGYKTTAKGEAVTHKLNARSDLYIYFYFHAMSLLSDHGSFSFITSNSWLDAGYGKDLQEFLLKRCHVKLVIDNKSKRSFKAADVNTVIVLFGPPQPPKVADRVSLDKQAKFVMFYVSFEEALHPVIFDEIAETDNKITTPDYRVFPALQAELLADGCEIPKNAEKKKTRVPLIKTAKYIGNKWGGKYLRAPDFLLRLLSETNQYWSTIGKQFRVETYLNTGGADDFFFLDLIKSKRTTQILNSRFIDFDLEIKSNITQVFLESPRQLTARLVQPDHLQTRILTIPENYRIEKTKIAEYLKLGEANGFHRASGRKNVRPWYKLPPGAYSGTSLLWPCRFNDIFYVCWNPDKVVSHRFYRLVPLAANTDDRVAFALLNSTFVWLCAELFAGSSLGAGVLDINGQTIKQIPLLNLSAVSGDKVLKFAKPLAEEPLKDLYRHTQSSALRAIDEVVFDILGLTKSERDAVYRAVIDLVESRLKKASSLKETAKRKKRVSAVDRTLGVWSDMPAEILEDED